MQFRIIILVLIASMLKSTLNINVSNDLSIFQISYYIFSESIIGLVIGLSVKYYIAAISFMTTAIFSLIGFNPQFQPAILDDEMESTFTAIINNTFLLLIMLFDFHRKIIFSLSDSYRIMPIGVTPSFEIISNDLIDTLNDSFLFVFNISGPFFIYAIIMNVFSALINKIIPSLPIYFVATPFILSGGLIIAYFNFPIFLSSITDNFFDIRFLK
jgi:flagellar biosynthesis protein FliR